MIIAIRHKAQFGTAYFVKTENEIMGTRNVEDATDFTQEEAEKEVKENTCEHFHSYCIKERESEQFIWKKFEK